MCDSDYFVVSTMLCRFKPSSHLNIGESIHHKVEFLGFTFLLLGKFWCMDRLLLLLWTCIQVSPLFLNASQSWWLEILMAFSYIVFFASFKSYFLVFLESYNFFSWVYVNNLMDEYGKIICSPRHWTMSKHPKKNILCDRVMLFTRLIKWFFKV